MVLHVPHCDYMLGWGNVVAATTFSPKVCYRVGGVGPIWSRDLDWLGAGYAPNLACSAILVVLLLLYHWGVDIKGSGYH